MIVSVSFIWVFSSFLVQGIESTGTSPTAITYVANSLFAVCLPAALLARRRSKRRGEARPGGGAGEEEERASLVASSAAGRDARERGGVRSFTSPTSSPTQVAVVGASGESGSGAGVSPPPPPPSTLAAHRATSREIVRAAAIVAPLWFAAQLVYNASLGMTSVTSNTILSSTASLWTYLFSVLARKETYTHGKLLRIAAILLGTAVVTFADAEASKRVGKADAGLTAPVAMRNETLIGVAFDGAGAGAGARLVATLTTANVSALSVPLALAGAHEAGEDALQELVSAEGGHRGASALGRLLQAQAGEEREELDRERSADQAVPAVQTDQTAQAISRVVSAVSYPAPGLAISDPSTASRSRATALGASEPPPTLGSSIAPYVSSLPPGARAAVGDALCVFSAVLYGLYTLAIRLSLASDDAADTAAFFGTMGLGIFAVGGAGISLLALVGVGPPRATARGLELAAVKGLLDNVLSDFLWARSILLIGPTLATAGLALQVPVAALSDALFATPAWLHGGVGPMLGTFLGAGLVLYGFFALLLEEKNDGAAVPAALEAAVEAQARARVGGGV